ncbi:MAG: hypothetical protein RIK87_10530 [Fuerstiella sp.]
MTPAAYLDSLADSAQEWFGKRPDTARAVATRIAQFRQGCSTLILADHAPLSAEDRTWLVGKCRARATKLDGHLAAVEAGQDAATVLTAADDTVNKLITALRGRAAELKA